VATAKPKMSIGLLVGAPKPPAEEDDADYGDDAALFAAAFPDSGEWTEERMAAFRELVHSCMEKG